jgi:5-formyltetrahydrofolate cyclo-ligase
MAFSIWTGGARPCRVIGAQTHVVFDPEVEAFLRHQAKRELRKRMRALRNSIPESARAARSARIVTAVTESDLFELAHIVGMFAPMLDRNEVDVRPIEGAAREQGKRVAYPFLEESGEMSFRLAAHTALEEQGHGFAEPPPESPLVEAYDGLLVVVPALAVAPNGHRLGYGKGHYDRLLARIAPPARTVTVAYDFQVLGELPVTDGDRPSDLVVTDARTFRVTPDAPPRSSGG